jgi:hypothetical protein
VSTVTTATETSTASAPDATRATSPHFRMILWTAVYCIPALSVMTSVEDLDVWWHLRTAEWITAHGKLPQTDPFTAFGAGQQFHAYSWLFELILWVPFRLFGLSGVLLFRAVFLFVLLAAVHRFIAKRQPDFVPQVVLFALTCVAFVPLMSERPWLFTILFYLLTLDVILDLRAGRAAWTVWSLPLAFALWANLIWRLPQYPAAIDGRANLHGNERVSRFHATWKGLPGWRDDPDLAASRTVVIQTWSPLAGLLRLDGRFELVHEDPVALVFVSRSVKTPTPDRRSHASAE